MYRSDSDSALPLSQSESRGLYCSKPRPLPSRLHPLQAGSGLSGGGLEKSSSLVELRGSPAPGPAPGLSVSCSTRSLCITPDAVDGPAASSSSSASSGSSGSARGAGLQPPTRRSPEEEDGGEEAEATGSRRRNAFNKIFRKKQGRH